MANTKEASGAATYRFGDIPVRVVFLNTVPWFMERDIIDALGLEGAPPVKGIDRGLFGSEPVVSEAGVLALTFHGDPPTAGRFRAWLASEVLPSFYRDAYIAKLRSRIVELEGLTGADGKRGTYRHLQDEEKAEIIKLKNEGWTIQGLSRKFRRGDTTIRAVLKGGW
jgi:hypothetical protein